MHTAVFRQLNALMRVSMLDIYKIKALRCHAALQAIVRFTTAWNLPIVSIVHNLAMAAQCFTTYRIFASK